jgi:hypothetical protein
VKKATWLLKGERKRLPMASVSISEAKRMSGKKTFKSLRA